MAGSKKLEVQIVGDASRLNRSFRDASSSAGSFGNKMMKVGKIAAVGLGAGLAAVGYGLKKSVDAAIEAEKAQTRLDAAFKSASVSAKDRAKAMEDVNKVSFKSGLDDEDLMDTLSRLTRVTGSASKAQRDMAIAANLARGRGIELSAATMIVTKAELGNVGALKRIGIEIPKVTAAQDALKASHGKVTAEQMKQAKATDDLSTRQAAIAALQKQYAGASEAYGKTAAGAQDRFKVAVENLQEAVGAKLLPVLTRFLTWVVANLPAFERVTKQVFDRVAAVINALKPTFNALIAGIRAIVQFAVANWPKVQEAAAKVVAWYRGTLQPAIQNVVAAVTAIWNKFGGAITRIAQTAFTVVTTVIRNAVTIIKSVIEGVLALIRGDWSQAWNSLKTIVSTVFASIGAIIKGFASIAFTAAKAIGSAIVQGVVSGMSGLFSAVKDKIVGGIKGAISAAGGILHGSGDFMFTRHAVGAPLAEGIALGFIDRMKVTNAAMSREMVAMGARLAAITARREAEDRVAAVRDATAALAEARKKKDGVVAAELALARAREDIIVAGLNATLAKEQAIYDRRQTLIQVKMDKLNAAIQRAQEKAAAIFAKMQDKIMRAFDAVRGGIVTPAEAALAAITDRRRNEDLQKALQDAISGGDPAAIARAQEDIQIASLERQATVERTALDQQTEAMREKLQDKLDKLDTMGKVWKGGTNSILALLKGYGVDFANVGALLGDAFRKSLIASIQGAAKAPVAGAAKAVGGGGGGQAAMRAASSSAGPPQVIQLVVSGKKIAEVVNFENALAGSRGNVPV